LTAKLKLPQLLINKQYVFPNREQQHFHHSTHIPKPICFQEINNMDQAQVMKREREDWERTYHKMLKGLEVMIDMQKMIKDIKKLVEEANMTLTGAEGMILNTSINNRTMNATNIMQILEDLWCMVQSDMEEQTFQTQRILADELD